MAKQTVNLGTMADNKSGDPLRTAFEKINENFDELYAKTVLLKPAATTADLELLYNEYFAALTLFELQVSQQQGMPGYPYGLTFPLGPQSAEQLALWDASNQGQGLLTILVTKAHEVYVSYNNWRLAVESAEITSGDKTWTFSNEGTTYFPGALTGQALSNTFIDTAIKLSTTTTINKITPVGGGNGGHYHLPNGFEGQIMYIVPAEGGEMNTHYTTMSFDSARWSNGNGVINQNNASWWLPFHGSQGGHAVLTLIFTDGAWNLPHNYFD